MVDAEDIEVVWAQMNSQSKRSKPPVLAVTRQEERQEVAVVAEEFLERQRAMALLSSPDYRMRKLALASMLKLIESNLEHDTDALTRPFLKRIVDKREQCRSLAIDCMCALISARLTDVDKTKSIPLILPVLKYRLLDQDDLEPSEEIRTKLLQLCQLILPQLSLFPADSIPFLCGCLSDRCPEVIYLASQALAKITALADSTVLSKFGKFVVMALQERLGHKASRIRICVIRAVKVWMHHGAAETIRCLTAFRESNVIPIASFYGPEVRSNAFAALVDDPVSAVRREFFSMLGHWRLELRECLDYETLIVPYLLSGIFDVDESIQAETVRVLEDIGAQYESYNEDDLYEIKRFQNELTRQAASTLVITPFDSRPGIGARIIVRAQLKRLLPAIIREMTDWKASPRNNSVQLLRILLFYSEETATPNAQEILEVISSNLACENNPVAQECAMLVGRHVPLEVWVLYLTESNNDIGAVRTLLMCLQGMGREQELATYCSKLVAWIKDIDQVPETLRERQEIMRIIDAQNVETPIGLADGMFV